MGLAGQFFFLSRNGIIIINNQVVEFSLQRL
jgi:hypothetical protein